MAKNIVTRSKEIRILKLLSHGKNMYEIGKSLGISRRTVEQHILVMRRIEGAENVAHLIAIAFRKKLIK